jgi:hypothetical protein
MPLDTASSGKLYIYDIIKFFLACGTHIFLLTVPFSINRWKDLPVPDSIYD